MEQQVGLPLRRSGRAHHPPLRFADLDYDGFNRHMRARDRVDKRRQQGGKVLTDNEVQSGDTGDNRNACMPIDDSVDNESAEGPELDSDHDRSADYVSEDVFNYAHEALFGWACSCSVNSTDHKRFALLTGEASEVRSDPKSEMEARSCINQAEWRQTEQEEFQALIDEDVADVVDRPTDASVLPRKFVYKTKRDEKRNFVRLNRFVPLGCSDPWKSLKETLSPTLRYATLRVLISIAASMGTDIHQLDVKTEFLNGILKTAVLWNSRRDTNMATHQRKSGN